MSISSIQTPLSETYEFDAFLRNKEEQFGNPFTFARRHTFHSEQMVHGSSVIPRYELDHNREPIIVDFNDDTDEPDSPKTASSQPTITADEDLTPEQLARRLRNREKKLKMKNRRRRQGRVGSEEGQTELGAA